MYFNLDNNGYALSASKTPVSGAVEYDASGLDLSGERLRAHRWDGEKLILDETRLAELEQQSAAAQQTIEKAMYDAAVRQEIQAALLSAQVNTLDVDDDTALRWRSFYPEWKAGTDCTEGYKVQRADKLYKVIQAHTSQAGWEPENAPSLWAGIDETHAGTLEDPIPYSGNMALTAGLYYTQDGVTYLCTLDTGNPVYAALIELVGIYVEAVN